MPDYVTKTWLKVQRLIYQRITDEHAKTRVDDPTPVLPLKSSTGLVTLTKRSF